MAKKRAGLRLSDLNVPGKVIEITGTLENGDEVTLPVWIRKLSPDEHDTCVRKGAAARSRLLAQFKDPESDESRALRDQLEQYTDETLRMMLTEDEKRKVAQTVEAQLLADDSEWGKDDYLVSLREDWLDDPDGTPGLHRRWQENNDDPQAKRVYEELQRFGEVAENRINRMVAGRIEEIASLPREPLIDRTFEHLKDAECHAAWIIEYDAWQLALGVRLHDPDIGDDQPHPEHKERYFENREEVRHTSPRIVNQLLAGYQEMVVDIQAGKGSRPGPTSSPPSETPAEPEAVQPSFLQAAHI